jgi:hypothetical protein
MLMLLGVTLFIFFLLAVLFTIGLLIDRAAERQDSQ